MLVKKKIKLISISKLKKKADKLFSIFIRQRDGGKCITCGKIDEWKYMQAGHYIQRDCLALRYDEKNVNCQCYACNVLRKGNYPIYAIKMIEKYGDDILFELDEIFKESKKNIKKYGREFYQEVIKKYGGKN